MQQPSALAGRSCTGRNPPGDDAPSSADLLQVIEQDCPGFHRRETV